MDTSAGLLLRQLQDTITSTFDGNDALRLQLVAAARKVFHTLETNEEKTMRLAIEEPVMFASLQALIDTGLWHSWVSTGNGDDRSVEELAQLMDKSVDPELLRHLLRIMATNHIIVETGQDRYRLTEFSKALGDKSTLLADGLRIRTDHINQTCQHWPIWLAKTNYRKPLDDKNSCYIDSFPEKKSFFDRCSSNPTHQESFSSFMDLWGKQKRPWPSFYDTETLFKGVQLDEGKPFVVDVGGHHGIDLMRLLERHPDVPSGSLVLQDLPEVLAAASVTTDKIRMSSHNLFEKGAEQPVKGARAYYMHAVLHDWSDETSIDILRQTAAAMTPGYSKILINDIVLPPTGVSSQQAALDCLVLQASANERTEAVWHKVVESAGLKLVKIWPDGRGYESIIEAELPC